MWTKLYETFQDCSEGFSAQPSFDFLKISLSVLDEFKVKVGLYFCGNSSENLGLIFSALYLSNSTIRVTGPFHSKYYIQWFKGPKCNILAYNVLISFNFLVPVIRICCVRGNNHCWWKIQKGAVKDPLVIKVLRILIEVIEIKKPS